MTGRGARHLLGSTVSRSLVQRASGGAVPTGRTSTCSTTVQRIVVRNGLSRDLADDLLEDIREETSWLDAADTPMPTHRQKSGFHH